MNKILSIIICLLLVSCSVSPRYSSSSSNSNKKVTKSYSAKKTSKNISKKNDFKVGDIISGISSWYGPNFHGKLTAIFFVNEKLLLSSAIKIINFC